MLRLNKDSQISHFTSVCWGSFISVNSGPGSARHASTTHETDAPPSGISVAERARIIAQV